MILLMKIILPGLSKQNLQKAVRKIQCSIADRNFPNNKQKIEICAEQNINLNDAKDEPHLIR